MPALTGVYRETEAGLAMQVRCACGAQVAVSWTAALTARQLLGGAARRFERGLHSRLGDEFRCQRCRQLWRWQDSKAASVT
jgi:hypothetical protein